MKTCIFFYYPDQFLILNNILLSSHTARFIYSNNGSYAVDHTGILPNYKQYIYYVIFVDLGVSLPACPPFVTQWCK